MAYGAKYIFTFSDVYQDTTGQYVATIYKKDYDGPIYEVSCTGDPLIIETDRSGDSIYRPFIASKATFNLFFRAGTLRYWDETPINWDAYSGTWDADNFDFTEFVTAEVDTFYFDLQKLQPGDVYSTIWKGWYIYTSDLTISEIEPISISLQFSDSLLMKVNTYFNNTTPNTVYFKPNDKVSLLEALLKCSYLSGLTSSIMITPKSFGTNVYQSYQFFNSVPNGTKSLPLSLSTTYVYKNAFLESIGSYSNIFDSFNGILNQLGMTAYFKNGSMYIVDFDSLLNDSSRYYDLYQVTNYGTSTDVLTYSKIDTVLEYDLTFPLNSAAFKNIDRSQSVSFNFPSKNVVIANNGSINNNIANHNMTSISKFRTPGFAPEYLVDSWFNNNGNEVTFDPLNSLLSTTFIPRPFFVYSTTKTYTIGDRIGTYLNPRNTGGLGGFTFDEVQYTDTTGVSVNPGDYISFQFTAYTDGRLKNLSSADQAAYGPNIYLYLILSGKDDAGNDVNYIYNNSTGTFDNVSFSFSLSSNYRLPITRNVNYINDSDRLISTISGNLDIPSSGQLKVRMSRVWHQTTFGGGNNELISPAYALFMETCNLQAFKGEYLSTTPKTQQYDLSYSNVLNSNKTIQLDSKLFQFDGTAYLNIPEAAFPAGFIRKSPFIVSSQIGNHIVDEFGIPAISSTFDSGDFDNTDISYSTIRTNIQSELMPILENECLLGAEINGTFKSYMLPLGTKFTYDVISYPTKTFIMLDNRTDYKNGTQDAILYSIAFSDPTGKTSQLTVKTS